MTGLSRTTSSSPETCSVALASQAPFYCWVDGILLKIGSRAVGVAMAFTLIESAQARWQVVNARTSSSSSPLARCYRRASWSSDPTNHEEISKSRNTPIHRS